MKNLSLVLLSVLMILSLTVAVFAAPEDEFAPSIGEKPAPGVNGDVQGCDHSRPLIVTTPGSDDASDLLEEIFEDITENGNASFPESDDLVIRDLFEVQPGCEHPEEHLNENGTYDIVIETGMEDNSDTHIYGYVAGEWRKLPAKDNGDGTMTATVSAFGPMAVLVKATPDLPQTGDTKMTALWISTMAVSFVALQTLAVIYTKKNKKAAAEEE